MARLAKRALALPLLAWMLLPLPAQADGISGGLAAMQALAMLVLVVFAAVWLGVWLIVRAFRRREPEAPRAWLRDPSIPIGLRALTSVQLGLAFVYGYGAVIEGIFPGHYQNGRIHPEVVQSISFGAAFAVLALVSASATRRQRNPRGFKRGIALGGLCLGHGLLAWTLHGRYAVDGLAVMFGAALLVLFHGRYRAYFGCERRSALFRGLTAALRIGAAATAALTLLAMASSLIVTTVLPDDLDEAEEVLEQVADAMRAHRNERGDWPESLDELGPAVKRSYRWHPVEYMPEEQELWMDLQVIEYPDLAYRLTFGLRGHAEEIARIGHRLR